MSKAKNLLLLKIDENFVPAPTEQGDEYYPNGIFVFNITKMLNYINNNREEFELRIIKIKDHRSGFGVINEDHIGKVDISVPIILAEISPGRYNVIDGNHRMEKAYRDGVETIPAYVLTMRQHLSFLTTVEAYRAYINYWNGKVKEME